MRLVRAMLATRHSLFCSLLHHPHVAPTLLLAHPSPSAGVLFYDLLHLATFQQRLAPAAAAPPGDPEEVDWEQAEAVVRELEAQIGSAQEFVR